MISDLEKFQKVRNDSLQESLQNGGDKMDDEAKQIFTEIFKVGYNRAAMDIMDGKHQTIIDEYIRNTLCNELLKKVP